MDSSDSESVVSTSTFDDSYYDQGTDNSFEFRPDSQTLVNYVEGVHLVIRNHEDITIDNALALNAQYRKLLEELKAKFEEMLRTVREKYVANEALLETLRNSAPSKNISCRSASIYICGAPYFKDSNMTPCPNNPDYLHRKKNFKEFFPIDSATRKCWTMNDKTDIVKGVKEQMINFLRAGSSSSISEIRNKQKASRSVSKRIDNIRGANADLDKKPFIELYNMLDETKFKIDWNKISFKNLDSRHTPNECLAMWVHYLKPGLNHGPWTDKEDDRLQDAIICNNYQDWNEISKVTDSRSSMHCFVHYRTTLSESVQVKKNEKFTQFEDQQLLELVEKYREGDNIYWSKVCQQIPGRNRYQCYHRYMFTLRPGIKREKFTAEEDCAIMAYVEAHGENFGRMPPNLVPGRTGVQVRNRYMNTLKVAKNKEWTFDEDRRLVDFVEKNGTKSWSEIAKIFGTKTRFACRCRYGTITRYLKKYPDADLKDVPRKDKAKSTQITRENFIEKAAQLREQRKMQEVLLPNSEMAIPSSSSLVSCISTVKTIKGLKTNFIEKLDKNESQLFKTIKYSYNWCYIPLSPSSDRDYDELLRTYTTLQLLDFDLDFKGYQTRFALLPIRTQLDLTNSLNCSINEAQKEDIRIAKVYGNHMPPNLNTLLGWRALMIMLKGRTYVKPERPKIAYYNHKLDLFKRRVVQLFYWSALLSRIDWRVVRQRLRKINVAEEDPISTLPPLPMDITPKIERSDSPEIINEPVLEDGAMIDDDNLLGVTEDENENESEENAVDFLLNHIKNDSMHIEDENLLETNTVGLDMPNFFYEITSFSDEESIKEVVEVDIKANSAVKRMKVESSSDEICIEKDARKPIATKKRKLVTGKSMPLT